MKRTKYLIWFIALMAIFPPSIGQAQDFGVSPSEVRVDNLAPGKEAEFELTIRNRDEVPHVFTFSTFHPQEKERRQGRADFPDGSWISFSPQKLEVPANSTNCVKVTVTIPAKQKWADKDWEVWLRITPEEKEFLVVNYYIRFLVSTAGEATPTIPIGFVLAIIAAVVLIIWGIFYSRSRSGQSKC